MRVGRREIRKEGRKEESEKGNKDGKRKKVWGGCQYERKENK